MRDKKIVISLIVLVLIGGYFIFKSPQEKPSEKLTTEEILQIIQPDNAPLKVLDVSERTFEDQPSIAVILSTVLESTKNYDRYLTVTRKGEKVSGSWILSDNQRILYFPHINPKKTYKVLIKRGLPAANGSELEAASEKEITTREITPAAGFASKGSVLPGEISEGLPIMTVNVPEVDVEFLRVNDEKLPQFLASSYFGNARLGQWDFHEFIKKDYTKSVYLSRFTTEAKPNIRTITHIPVKDIEELKQPGLYVAIMKKPGEYQYYYNTTFFLVSDIGLHARVYQENMDVYLSSLKTGESISDVGVELWNNKGKSIKKSFSDGKGKAHFNVRPNQNNVLIARHKNQLAILSFKNPALDLSEFETKGTSQNQIEPFVFSNRDLFRPGEDVPVSILLRDEDGRAVKDYPLTIELKKPDGRSSSKFTLQPQKLGFYTHTLHIPDDGQTGKWKLEVRTNPADKDPLQIFTFSVEDFLPERMKLSIKSDQQTIRSKENLKMVAEGAYLYGAPASGNRFKAVMNVRPHHHPIEELKDFFFGDVNEAKSSLRENIVDTAMDEKGLIDFTCLPVRQQYNSPMQVKITGNVYETGGRPVTRSMLRISWPADTLIAVRPTFSGEFAETNSSASFEIIKASPDGTLHPVKGLNVKVIREDRSYHWSYNESGGWRYEYSESQYPILEQNLDIPKAGRAEFLVPVEYGAYRIEIIDPSTELVTRYRFHAGWNWRSKKQEKTARPDRVNITLDKQFYKHGDVVSASVIPPHAGEGIVMVEADGLIWSKRLHIPAEGTTVDIPISEKWGKRHDLYISAIVFRPGEAKDKITPNRAIGLIHLPLDRTGRKHKVSLDLPEQILPSSKLKVTVNIEGLKAKPTMVVVAAVDLGILNITDFPTPDPHSHFFAKRRYGVDTYDMYSKIIETLDGVKGRLRFGGDADLSSLRKSKNAQAKVKTVALISLPVEVSESGEAVVELDIPDYNGSLRVMAVAFSEDSFGSSEGEVIVAAPVIAEIATPRFLSPADKSMLTLDLHNLSGKDQSLQIKLSTTTPLILKKVDRKISLADKEKSTLRFDLSAEKSYGVGKINLVVTGKDVNIDRQWELGVRPAYPGETRIKRQKIAPGSQLDLDTGLLADLMPKTVDGTLVVSSAPPLNVRDAVKGLLRYPYGCLEQTTSSAYPHVYVDENKAVEMGLEPVKMDERVKRLETAFERIKSMQLPSGGFGLWNNKGPEQIWLTPYVVDFLQEARSHGFLVPDDMLQKGQENLLKRIQSGMPLSTSRYYTQSPNHLLFASNAYAAYVLAKVQRAPLGTLRTLYENHRAEAESGLPLIQLGLALHLSGDKSKGMNAIKEGLEKVRPSDKYLGDYGSIVRDIALSLALLDRHSINANGQLDLLYTLSDNMLNRRYFSTQERLAIFLAGYGISKNQNQEWTAEVSFAGETKTVDRTGRAVFVFPFEEIKKGIKFVSKADIPLYSHFEINGYPDVPPKPESKYFHIARTIYDIDGNIVIDRELHVGELLIAQLALSATQRIENALVVDLLPAGLEIENLNLTKGETLDDLMINEVNPRQAMNNEKIKHQEYRGDRFVAALDIDGWGQITNLFYLLRVVSPGKYQVPPPFVEDMYRSEIRGIGETTGRISIINESR